MRRTILSPMAPPTTEEHHPLSHPRPKPPSAPRRATWRLRSARSATTLSVGFNRLTDAQHVRSGEQGRADVARADGVEEVIAAHEDGMRQPPDDDARHGGLPSARRASDDDDHARRRARMRPLDQSSSTQRSRVSARVRRTCSVEVELLGALESLGDAWRFGHIGDAVG
jgi:hypothetical protein